MARKHFGNKLNALIIASLVALTGLFALLISVQDADAANIPSTINSDWTVSTVIVYDGGNCVLSGNLTIQSGGNLTLRNLTLALNNQLDGQYKILVNSGGTLNIYNSTIKSNTDHRTSKLESQGTLFVTGSTLRDFGPSSGYNGIRSWAGKATFKNTTITNNSIGLQTWWVNPVIEDCVFININYRGFDIFEAWATLKRVKFINASSTTVHGAIFASANTRLNVLDSEISDTTGNGFYLDDGRIEIYNTTFNNNTNDFYIYRSSIAKIFINVTNTTFKKATFTGAGGAAQLSVYWYVNISSMWESDQATVPGGDLLITDKNDLYITSGPLDGNGKMDLVRLKEREETTGTKTSFTPHKFNLTGQRGALTRTNETSVSITKSLDLTIALDDLPPQLDISAPLEDLVVNKTTVSVEGITEPGCQLWVDDVPAQVGTDGTFVTEATLGNEGSNSILVKVRDPAGNEREKIVNVTRDTTVPNVTITAPKNGDVFNTTSVEVFGTAEVGASLTVNNVATTIGADGKFNRTLTLQEGDNQISVECTDGVHNKATVSVTVKVDLTGPMLQVITPVDGYKTNATSVLVTGLTELDANVTINSAVVDFPGGTFEAIVPLEEGDNTIWVRSCDKVFNCNQTSVRVIRDTVPPSLVVFYPPVNEELLTNKENITVQGYVEPGSMIWINSDEQTYSGNWTHVYELKEGKNIIVFEAVDDVGNRIELKRIIIRDTLAPGLSVTYPKNNLRTREAQVTIKGEVEANSTLKMNDAAVSVQGTSFEQAVTLEKEGKNEFDFTAKDLAGNSKTIIVTIVRDTIVNLTLTSPLDGEKTKNATIIVKGTTDPGATLNFNNITVNADSNGKFEKEIALVVGDNTISVKATDELGNKKVSSLTIIREKKSTPSGPFLGSLLIPIVLCVVVVICVAIGAIAMKKKKATPPPPPSEPQPPGLQQQVAQGPSEQWAPPQGPPQGPPEQLSYQATPQSPEGQPPQWPGPPAQ